MRQKLMDFLLHGKPSYEHKQFVFRFAAAQPVAHLTVFEIGMTVDYIHAARNDVQAFYPFGVQFIPDCMRSDQVEVCIFMVAPDVPPEQRDRKSTRLNSSHVAISYAVF